MDIEKHNNPEGPAGPPEEHNEGDPYYGPDGQTVIGHYFKNELSNKWLVDHEPFTLTDVDKDMIKEMSDEDARAYLLQRAQEEIKKRPVS